MQIGEMLVRAKAVRPADLEEAVGWQVLYGDRLGTNLLELGLVDEKVLAECLGKQQACEWAYGNLDIPESMVQALPAVIARRAEIVPWKIEGRRLKVLTIAPNENLALFDDMGFRIGKQVKPVVAPEFRIHQLLRRYFGSVRTMRAIDFGVKPKGKRQQDAEKKAEQAEQDKAVDLMDDDAFAAVYQEVLAGRPQTPAPSAAQTPAPPPPAAPPLPARASPPAGGPPPGWNAPPATPMAPPVVARTIAPVAMTPAVVAAPAPMAVGAAPTFEVEGLEEEEPLLDAELLEELPVEAIEETGLGSDQWAAAFQDLEQTLLATEPAKAPPRDLSPLSFKDAVAEIGKAQGRDAVALTVLRYALSKARRAVLINVQGDVALGWDAVGEDLTTDVARHIALPLSVPSAFNLVRTSRSHYIGPLGKESGNVRFLKLAGKKWPASAVLLPVLFRGKVVYILYVDNGHKQHVDADVGELMILSQNITRSMEQMVAQRQAQRKS